MQGFYYYQEGEKERIMSTKKETTACSDACECAEQDSPFYSTGAEQATALEDVEEQKENPKQKKTKEQELTETLQRLQADFENYRKRTEKENAEFRQYATKKLLTELLPILDNFEMALRVVDDEGFKLIYAQLFEIMERYGLQRIDALDKKYDPRFHEALLQEDSEKEPGTILEELQKGYIVGETVVRPARVKISTRKNEAARVSTGGNKTV